MVEILNSYGKIIKINNKIKIIEAFEYDFRNPKTIEQISKKTNIGMTGVKTHLRQLWADGIINKSLGKMEYQDGKLRKINIYYLNEKLSKEELFKYTVISFWNAINES